MLCNYSIVTLKLKVHFFFYHGLLVQGSAAKKAQPICVYWYVNMPLVIIVLLLNKITEFFVRANVNSTEIKEKETSLSLISVIEVTLITADEELF